jgi:hypothetical protein
MGKDSIYVVEFLMIFSLLLAYIVMGDLLNNYWAIDGFSTICIMLYDKK